MAVIELLTVANHAEAVNGLLYLSGAGWTDLRRSLIPGRQAPVNPFGIAVATLVPWNEANQRHHIVVQLEAADGNVIWKVEGDFEVGRPAGTTKGMDLRSVMALNAQVQFPAAGVYRVSASVGEDKRSVSFCVRDVPLPLPLGTTG